MSLLQTPSFRWSQKSVRRPGSGFKVNSVPRAAGAVVGFVLLALAKWVNTGARSAELFERLNVWTARDNKPVMAVLFLIIAVKLVGDAISGFST